MVRQNSGLVQTLLHKLATIINDHYTKQKKKHLKDKYTKKKKKKQLKDKYTRIGARERPIHTNCRPIKAKPILNPIYFRGWVIFKSLSIRDFETVDDIEIQPNQLCLSPRWISPSLSHCFIDNSLTHYGRIFAIKTITAVFRMLIWCLIPVLDWIWFFVFFGV